MSDLTADGKKLVKAVESFVVAIRRDERVGNGCETDNPVICEAACRKRFRQLWKAIERAGDCHLGDVDDSEIWSVLGLDEPAEAPA